MKIKLFFASLLFALIANFSVNAQGDIVAVAAGNEDFSTLVAAVQAAELVDALQADGPYTVFAPTNAAFGKVPADALNSLLQPENKDKLTAILTYHVIAGKFDAKAVVKAIQEGNGKAVLTTLQGGKIAAMLQDGKVVLQDEQGNTSTVTATDVDATNGVIHVLDTVVMPD